MRSPSGLSRLGPWPPWSASAGKPVRFRRRSFSDVIDRQLDLFAVEHVTLLSELEAALEAYRREGPGAAEERYADYLELVDDGRDALEAMRESFAGTLEEGVDDTYRSAFDETARRRWRTFGFELGAWARGDDHE